MNNTLTTLDLRYNDIDSAGIRHLAEARKVNKSLAKLDLSGNNVKITGKKKARRGAESK